MSDVPDPGDRDSDLDRLRELAYARGWSDGWDQGWAAAMKHVRDLKALGWEDYAD